MLQGVGNAAIAVPSVVLFKDSLDELLFVCSLVWLLLRLDPVIVAALRQIDDVQQIDDWIILP